MNWAKQISMHESRFCQILVEHQLCLYRVTTGFPTFILVNLLSCLVFFPTFNTPKGNSVMAVNQQISWLT